jgi:hypothetical protein
LKTENYEIDFSQEDQALLAPLIAHKASNQFLAHFSKIKNSRQTLDQILQSSLKNLSEHLYTGLGILMIDLHTTNDCYLLGILAASPNGNRLLYEGLSLKSPNLYTDVRLNFSMDQWR